MKKLILVVSFFCFLSCREDIVEYESKAGTGDVYVTSNPDGADIYLNGDRLGKTTPDSLIDLQAGIYSVRLKLLGYGEETIYVNLQSGQKRFINVTLGSD
ncbi:MAG: PEGA domain-containing protein [Ignavibacteriales bacterium]|nr:PEGA domain-containing protein [Ignavibacteriales bacterium]